MSQSLNGIKKDFTEGLSQISRFWGFPKGMGAIFAVLYLSPTALSLDEIVAETGLTKGAISTEIRSLARMGLVHIAPLNTATARIITLPNRTSMLRSVRSCRRDRTPSLTALSVR